MEPTGEYDGVEQQETFLASTQRVERSNRNACQYRRLFWVTGALLLVIGTGLAIARLPRHVAESEEEEISLKHGDISDERQVSRK